MISFVNHNAHSTLIFKAKYFINQFSHHFKLLGTIYALIYSIKLEENDLTEVQVIKKPLTFIQLLKSS